MPLKKSNRTRIIAGLITGVLVIALILLSLTNQNFIKTKAFQNTAQQSKVRVEVDPYLHMEYLPEGGRAEIPPGGISLRIDSTPAGISCEKVLRRGNDEHGELTTTPGSICDAEFDSGSSITLNASTKDGLGLNVNALVDGWACEGKLAIEPPNILIPEFFLQRSDNSTTITVPLSSAYPNISCRFDGSYLDRDTRSDQMIQRQGVVVD